MRCCADLGTGCQPYHLWLRGPPGPNVLANGSAAAPSLSFSAGTGLFSSALNTFNIATSGVDRLSVRSGGDVGVLTGSLNLAQGDIQKGGTLFIRSRGSSVSLGLSALGNQTTGTANVAVGNNALANTNQAFPSDGLNTGVGHQALVSNTTGLGNTAVGYSAAVATVTGNFNTAVGALALPALSSGGQNIAIGVNAGFNTTTGSNNIWLGNVGLPTQSDTILIGQSQTRTAIAGIHGRPTLGTPSTVMIDIYGQLGTIASSRRAKDDIQDMGDASNGLMRLRPVSFRYKQAYGDGSRPVQYGLIAEEVGEVYPDLVQYSPTGEAITVQYHLVNAMLLNEVQKQRRQIDAQRSELQAQAARLAELGERLAALERNSR